MNGTDPSVLNDLRAWWSRFIVTTSDDDLDVLTVWTAHTWLTDVNWTTPRLVITAALPGSGKTTVLDHLSRLAVRPLSTASGMTGALLARCLVDGVKTILIDEAERTFRGSDTSPDLVAILNSGYKRGGSRPVLVPDSSGNYEVKNFPTYAPVAMAGNAPRLPDDTQQRCIYVRLMPDYGGIAEDSDWELNESDALELRDRLEAWAGRVKGDAPGLDYRLPPVVRGRSAEVWRPLKRTAQLAGGHWPETVDKLALQHLADLAADAEAGLSYERPHVRLARDLHAVWDYGAPGVPLPFMATEVLLQRLHAHDPESWDRIEYGQRKPLTATGLARMLREGFGLRSARESATGPRGWKRGDLAPAFAAIGLDP